ncbi:hypothetical protein EXS62_01840 [Candidatus Kaiserbacteria bacterium]|nr:hypothetical protein [Candidatus Kaiserbacteria bacterium]
MLRPKLFFVISILLTFASAAVAQTSRQADLTRYNEVMSKCPYRAAQLDPRDKATHAEHFRDMKAPAYRRLIAGCLRYEAHLPPMPGAKRLAQQIQVTPAQAKERTDDPLAQKALETLGEAPTARHTFRGEQKDFIPVPRGCEERKEVTPSGTFVRVVCAPKR